MAASKICLKRKTEPSMSSSKFDENLSSNEDSEDPKKKKVRTTFTGRQIFELEKMFENKKYLSSSERADMAKLLNVTEQQVKIWFQNRRTKWKKQENISNAEAAELMKSKTGLKPEMLSPKLKLTSGGDHHYQHSSSSCSSASPTENGISSLMGKQLSPMSAFHRPASSASNDSIGFKFRRSTPKADLDEEFDDEDLDDDDDDDERLVIEEHNNSSSSNNNNNNNGTTLMTSHKDGHFSSSQLHQKEPNRVH